MDQRIRANRADDALRPQTKIPAKSMERDENGLGSVAALFYVL
jgi:hypothetical protein